MPVVPLTGAKVKSLKPQPSRYRVSDGGNLYLEVMPTGAKFWRQKYRFNASQRTVTLGEYPAMRLAEARAAREEVKQKARRGVDPNPEATAHAEARAEAALGPRRDLFRDVAERWVRKRIHEDAAPITVAKYRSRLNRPLLRFGDTPVGDIEAREILHMLREVEGLRQFETASVFAPF